MNAEVVRPEIDNMLKDIQCRLSDINELEQCAPSKSAILWLQLTQKPFVLTRRRLSYESNFWALLLIRFVIRQL